MKNVLKKKFFILLKFVLSIIIITLDFIVLFYSKRNFCLIHLIFCSIIILQNFELFKKASKKVTSLELYNNNLHCLYDGVRGFKHDFDNIIITIGGYIQTDDLNGLKTYYNQLDCDCQKLNNLSSLTPNIINNAGIYNLLISKYKFANEKNVKINISFMLDLNLLNMRVYEFTRILGILLDNAIEASCLSDEKFINIIFKNDFLQSRQLVIIENSYTEKNIDVDKIYEKGTSSKEDHTGLGLWTVRKILKRHNNINLFTSKNNKLFSQQLEIYKNRV